MSPLPLGTTHAPVYTVHLPSGDGLSANVAFMETFESLLDQASPFALVLDARDAKIPDGRVRRHLVERLRARGPEFKEHCAGLAVVFANVMHLGVASTLSIFIDPPFPIEHFRDPDEAIEWARTRLCQRNDPHAPEAGPQ